MTKFFRPLLPSGPQPFYREIKKDICVHSSTWLRNNELLSTLYIIQLLIKKAENCLWENVYTQHTAIEAKKIWYMIAKII